MNAPAANNPARPVKVGVVAYGPGATQCPGNVEIPRTVWEAMTPAQRRELLGAHADRHALTNAAGATCSAWYIADPGDDAATQEPQP